jgi:hypothetical protein
MVAARDPGLTVSRHAKTDQPVAQHSKSQRHECLLSFRLNIVVRNEPDGEQSPKPGGSRTPKGGSARAEVNRVG